jgi:glycosyltransferase involved in cell wall biosynthesis
MPFFSVIIPTYNRLSTLPKTLDSVLAQTFTDFEVIIADDGSTDETASWVGSVSDHRVHYCVQQNKGVCAARNLGASKASGKYLIFLDSDDFVKQSWLSDFYEEISSTGAAVVYCKRIINGQTTDGTGYQGFLAGTFVIKKELFQSIGGYDEVLKFGENTELRWRIQQAGARIVFLNKPNVIYEVSSNGGGANRENRIRFYYHIEKKHAAYFKKKHRELQNLCQVAGVDCFVLNRKREALRLLWRGYRMNPIHLPSLLRFLKYLFSTLI